MKPSKYLEAISKELIETVMKSCTDGLKITALIETGDYNQTKFDMMRDDENFSYNKLIGIFPSVHLGYDGYGLIDTKKIGMGNYQPGGKMNGGDAFILHDLIHKYPSDRNAYIEGKKNNWNIYKDIIIELDTHFVRRLCELKEQGVDITYHIDKYVNESIKELQKNAVRVMSEVAKNILATGHNIVEIWDAPATYILDGATLQFDRYGMNNQKNIIKSTEHYNASGYPVLVRAAIDLYFIWYVDNLVVKGNVTDGKFVDKLLQYMNLAYEKNPFEAFMFISGIVDNNTDIRVATGYIDTLLSRIKYFGSGAALNTQIPPTFKHTPIFNPKQIFKAVHGDSNITEKISDDCTRSELIAESSRVDFFDIDKVIHMMALGRVKGETMIAESVNLSYSSIPSRDREVLRESARRAHQCKVEFEFMRDKYTKMEAIEKAYDTLEFMDKKKSKMTNDAAMREMASIEYSLNEMIRIASEKDIKAGRSEIIVKYPKGFEG